MGGACPNGIHSLYLAEKTFILLGTSTKRSTRLRRLDSAQPGIFASAADMNPVIILAQADGGQGLIVHTLCMSDCTPSTRRGSE